MAKKKLSETITKTLKELDEVVKSKLDYSLAPPEFDDVVMVLQHSAETGKYGRNDWLEGKNYDTESSIASMKRHIREYREGVRKDKDNGLHPMLMVACRALMTYTLDQRSDPYPEGYDAEGAEKSWSTGCVNTSSKALKKMIYSDKTQEQLVQVGLNANRMMDKYINTDYCNQCKFLKDSQAHKQLCQEGH